MPEPTAPPPAHDDVGALAFSSYWVQAYEYSFLTGDPEWIRSTSTSTASCVRCSEAVETITVVSAQDTRFLYVDLVPTA